MPPSDPACPTCGTQVRANDYWSYLAGPSSPRVYYPKSIMDDNPEIAGTFTRCADPFHAAPSDPAAVPPPDSHEPAGRVDVSGSAPEWAVEMAFAHTFPADYKAYGYAKARDVWKHLEGTSDWRRMYTLARLLASVREGALREAATLRVEFPGVVHGIANPCDACQIAYTTGSLDAADAIHKGLLSLLHTPPRGGAG